jgi:hypothetical protein
MPRGIYKQKGRNGTLEERFWKYALSEPNSGCWIWIGSLARSGYGQIQNSKTRQPETAHTLSWRINCGPIPDDVHVLHQCDQRWCCNPDHLFLGTNTDNIHDAQCKGRLRGRNVAKGEESGLAKLTSVAVREIRASEETLAVLAKRFGVTMALISAVRHRKIWKHI